MAVPHYPIRAFIKFSVTAQLTADLTGHSLATFVDRPGERPDRGQLAPAQEDRYSPLVAAASTSLDLELLRDLLQTALQSDHHPELYEAYPTQAEARAVEQAVIVAIVETYKTIKLNQLQPQVQNLNALL
ncbi:MAG: hypothetical protein AAFU71_19425 [Cyanobacteria bacterium J06632_22]